MNKVLLVGRLVRDPETKTTGSGIKYSRFTIAVNRQFSDDQADFVPIVAWRSQADFVGAYMKKGALMSIEGRFTSSTYKNNKDETVTRYEVTADRVQSLESKKASAERNSGETKSVSSTQTIKFAEETKADENTKENDVPWELDL
ncbi:MAG: single-stranded DNA-binding protein [Mycoplasmataceae bacterium]|nr:single-stranded DNA-binding protein [Mycoplasmataceae bacterium]